MLSSTKNFFFENISKVGLPGLSLGNSSREQDNKDPSSSYKNGQSSGGQVSSHKDVTQTNIVTHFDLSSNNSQPEDPPTDCISNGEADKEEPSFYSARDNDEQDTSMLMYAAAVNDKSKIGENNLRLNMFFSICLIFATLLLGALEWFFFET